MEKYSSPPISPSITDSGEVVSRGLVLPTDKSGDAVGDAEDLKDEAKEAAKSIEYQEDSVVSSVLDSIDGSRRASGQTSDDDIIPEQARKLLIALSRSGLPHDRRLELSEMARKVWEERKVNLEDIEFVRKRSGDRKKIGFGGLRTYTSLI